MIFNRYDRYPLWRIIVDDIFQANKTVMLLLIALLISAVSTIWVTHLTRLAISEKNQLQTEYQALQSEALNLRLEDSALSDRTRIEGIAKQLGMQSTRDDQEVLIIE
ncbi:cell division protein FtsL [Gallibacterium anatis]|uniref:Cell division protein FtsL n=1 Tax=Gallibacterium anatis 4895 TaxID=1396510 RepID=A0A0A3A835_9PAST|nr:cell division protein FtsL [Gallibacterium anatis]KGQ27090.1 cell division protein FtsL [Gallibacterium anatis]KGQ63392.1 cell division protein FtsL [Gallibacterium anatis 7990]KGQ63917.1 cell division protein FtsL [Gallibacterium anatis 4895]OZN50072.1 cell division protein FtsL [Gallibacterium anatis]